MIAPKLQVFRPEELTPWPGLNSREDFGGDDFDALVESVRTHGVQQPILVALQPTEPHYVLAGERRLRAAAVAGVSVPAMCREYSEEEGRLLVLIENLHRKDLNDIERARGYERALLVPGMTQAKLAASLKISQPVISNALRVLQLPAEIHALIVAGTVTMSAARDLLVPFTKIPEAKRAKLYAAIANELARFDRPVDDHSLRHIVGRAAMPLSHSLDPQEWGGEKPLFDPKLHKQCGCGGPAFEYSYRKSARCFDDGWWKAQQQAAKEAEAAKAKANRAALASGERSDVQDLDDAGVVIVRGRVIEEYGVHPADLPEGSLTAVTFERRRALVFTGSDEELEDARAAFQRRENETEEAAEVARFESARAEAVAAKWEPWMFIDALTAGWRVRSTAEGIAKRMEVDLKKPESVGVQKAQLLFKTALIAARREAQEEKGGLHSTGRFGGRSALQQEATAALRAMLPEEPRPGVPEPDVPELAAILNEAAAMEDDYPTEDKVRDLLARWKAFRAEHPIYEPTAEDLSYIEVVQEEFADDEESEDAEEDATCVVCGCSDSAACDEGCSWLAVDRDAGKGVCSSCAKSKKAAEKQLNEALAQQDEAQELAAEAIA